EGDIYIQVCCLNQTRTFVKKILSGKFLRPWETHHLYLNDCCLSFKALTGFLQLPVPYSSMSEIRKYVVARWDPVYKNCLSIVLPNGFFCKTQPVPYSSMSEIWKYVVARWDPAYKNCLSIVLPDGSLLLQDHEGALIPLDMEEKYLSRKATYIQVCCLNQTQTFVKQILSKTHYLYLNDSCLSSKTLTGFLQQPVPYSSMSEIRKYVVARWDPVYKNCFSIVLPDGSLLLQDSNAYTREQFCISEESTELSVNCHSNDSSVRSLRISRLISTSKKLARRYLVRLFEDTNLCAIQAKASHYHAERYPTGTLYLWRASLGATNL
ncbi:hypothetical protein DBV15_08993, partial [Temnothorax longispinosus]